MKQHINKAQLNELSEKGKKELKLYCKKQLLENPEWNDVPINDTSMLLSIGQMIEFLKLENIPYSIWEESTEKDFCDNLWGKTKEKLNE